MSKPTDVSESTRETTMSDFNAGMEFAAQVAADCTAWYEGHGDEVGKIAAEEIRARIKPGAPGWVAQLRTALDQIADPENPGITPMCDCQHDTKDCCALVGYYCPQCIAGIALKLLPQIPAASPVAPNESELDKEITRWQKAIYDLCREESGDDTIDGGGCDSGDPLDFTLAEISEAFGIIKDKLASPVAGGSARIAEIASRLAAITPGPWQMQPVVPGDKDIFIDAEGDGWARLRCEVTRDDCDTEVAEANAAFIAAAPDDIAYLLKLVPEGWVKVTPETMPRGGVPRV